MAGITKYLIHRRAVPAVILIANSLSSWCGTFEYYFYAELFLK